MMRKMKARHTDTCMKIMLGFGEAYDLGCRFITANSNLETQHVYFIHLNLGSGFSVYSQIRREFQLVSVGSLCGGTVSGCGHPRGGESG